MPKTIQLVYPMGKVIVSTHKLTSKLNLVLKNARHFKPSEYLLYYRLDSQEYQISLFPLYDSERPDKIHMKEYTALFSEIHLSNKTVSYSKLSEVEDGACFIVTAKYWPVEIHNFAKVCRVPMFFQAEDITELKLRLITFTRDFGHNKKALEDCKPFLNLIELRIIDSEETHVEIDNNKLSQLPISIKPTLHTTCCDVPLITAEGLLQVSDVPLSTIKREMENNKLRMAILDYSSEDGVHLHSESDIQLSECESAPIILRPNEMIFVFVGEFIASRARKNCFHYKSKKIAYKVSEDLAPRDIAKYLNLNLLVLDISEKVVKISDSKSEIIVKVITTRKNYWKYDIWFYYMMINNDLAVQTLVSEILALYNYITGAQMLFAAVLIIYSAFTIIGRMIVAYHTQKLRWYSIFMSVLGLDRIKEAYEAWHEFGNKATPFVNAEVVQLYLQTITSLILAILAQLLSTELKWVLLLNIFSSSFSVCMGLSLVHSCFMPLDFDPKKNPWDTPLYGVLFEKKFHQNYIWKLKQLVQFLLELSSRCFVLCVTLLLSPIAFGTFLYIYFLLEAAYSMRNIHSPTLLWIVGCFSVPPVKSFVARDLVFVPHSQLKEMMKKDLLNPEMLIIERYYYTHILVKIFRIIPFAICIIYLLYDDNYRSQNDACTYSALFGFTCTIMLLMLYVYDCLILRHFARIEREKKFTPLNSNPNPNSNPNLNSKKINNSYKIVPLESLIFLDR